MRSTNIYTNYFLDRYGEAAYLSMPSFRTETEGEHEAYECGWKQGLKGEIKPQELLDARKQAEFEVTYVHRLPWSAYAHIAFYRGYCEGVFQHSQNRSNKRWLDSYKARFGRD